MHAGEVDTNEALIRRLLIDQFPQWSAFPVTPVVSSGTDNALYRLGDELVVRLPRIEWARGGVGRDGEWLPKLAPRLPIAVPVPVAVGRPGAGYPYEWGIYPWLDGENPSFDGADADALVSGVAQFLTALRAVEIDGGPKAGRGGPLAERDEATRAAIADVHGLFDTRALTAAWESALAEPQWTAPPVWVHGDVLPGNLIVDGGRLTGVIDWSGMGVGDPACDLMIAWNLFSAHGREAFRNALAIDDATWARGRGWALSQALIFIPYYLETNPAGVRNARRAVEEILAS